MKVFVVLSLFAVANFLTVKGQTFVDCQTCVDQGCVCNVAGDACVECNNNHHPDGNHNPGNHHPGKRNQGCQVNADCQTYCGGHDYHCVNDHCQCHDAHVGGRAAHPTHCKVTSDCSFSDCGDHSYDCVNGVCTCSSGDHALGKRANNHPSHCTSDSDCSSTQCNDSSYFCNDNNMCACHSGDHAVGKRQHVDNHHCTSNADCSTFCPLNQSYFCDANGKCQCHSNH